jgi:glycerol-3-phosphate acyltransferase PlsY
MKIVFIVGGRRKPFARRGFGYNRRECNRPAPSPVLAAILIVLAAYLIGSVSFAVVVSKAFALPDPHEYGSRNPGATNVLRTGNKAAAALTLLGDGAKGWLAVFLAQQLAGPAGAAPWTVPAAALAVFVGHLFPVFHRFAGGKGVATAAGILLALSWPLALVLAAVWIVMALGFKISSLAALTVAVLAPVGAFYVFGNTLPAWIWVPIAVLLIWRHRSNIEKLLSGRERTIGR